MSDTGDIWSDIKFIEGTAPQRERSRGTDDMDAEVRRIIAAKIDCQEHFVARYLASTGARIQDTEMVEETSADGRQIVFWCRPLRRV